VQGVNLEGRPSNVGVVGMGCLNCDYACAMNRERWISDGYYDDGDARAARLWEQGESLRGILGDSGMCMFNVGNFSFGLTIVFSYVYIVYGTMHFGYYTSKFRKRCNVVGKKSGPDVLSSFGRSDDTKKMTAHRAHKVVRCHV
jgi:hypothetical protein